MATSDYIAIGILLFCAMLGTFGMLKWLLRLAAGVVFGLAVLACIGLLAKNSTFDTATRGLFRGGVVIPCVQEQVQAVEQIVRMPRSQPCPELAMKE